MKRRSTSHDLGQNNTHEDINLGQNVLNNSSDDELDLLRSESSFLPVYSPLKEPRQQSFENGDYSTDFEQSVMWDTQSVSVAENNIEDYPIMTEEEAKKLIDLAATILQAHIRGFLVRRKFDFKSYKQKHDAASKIQALWKGYHFRHCNYQGLNIKCELRAQRLQKYVAMLCMMMQKAEEQHEEEKRKLLKAVSLLYDKFTQLFNKVEQQSVENKNKQNRLERNAAVTIQKHWRGHMVRKHHSRLKTSNAFQSLLTSHIQLKNKVEYLEALAENTKKGQSEFATTQEELLPAFLPHPRLFEGKEDGDESDVDESIGGQTKTCATCSSSDVSDADEDNEVSTIEDPKMSLSEDTEEQECAEDILTPEDGEGDFENKEEHMVHAMDENDLVEEEELRFDSNKVGETFENDKGNNEEFTEEIQDEVDKEKQLRDDGHHEEDIDQDVNEITDEEDEGIEDENGRIVDPMINLSDREGDEDGVIDTTLDNSFKTEVLTTEVVNERVIEDQGLKGGSEESEDSRDLLNPVDNKDETVEEIKDCDIEHDQEEHIESGDEEYIKNKENRTVGDAEDKTAHEIQEGTFNPTGLHLQDDQSSSSGAKDDETLEESAKTSSGITQGVQVHVVKFTDSGLISSKEDEQEEMNMEGFQGETKPEMKPSEADTTHVSPRLGKRASSLLSALKDEISNVRPKSPETEQSSVAQAALHLSSSDPDNASTDENGNTNKSLPEWQS